MGEQNAMHHPRELLVKRTERRAVARLFTRLEAGVFRPAVALFTTNAAVLPFRYAPHSTASTRNSMS